MKTCFTLALALFAFTFLHAQWESTNGPVGGWVRDLAQNNNYMFSTTDNGLYRSADGGNSWVKLSLEPNSSYSISNMSVNGTSIVVLGYDRTGNYERNLFKSDDEGDTWTLLNVPDSVGFADVAITDFAIYLLDTYALLISTDGGQSWQNSSLNSIEPYPSSITVLNQEVYVGGHGKMYISTANADIWTEYEIPGMVASADIISAYDDVIFVRDYQFGDLRISTNGGQSWQQSTTIDWGNGWTNFVKIGTSYYANHVGNIWKSDNQGLTWAEVPNNYYINFYKMIAHGNDLIGGAFFRGILRSPDLGNTFHPSNQGMDATVVNALTIGNGELLASCNYIGMYRYDQSQEIWDTTIFAPVEYDMDDIAVMGDKLFVTNDYGKIARSDDNGLSWIDVTPGGPFGFDNFNELTVDGNTLYTAGTDLLLSFSPLFKTTDLGQSWQTVSIQVGGTLQQPSFFAKNDDYLFMGGIQTVFRSADGGQTWEDITQGLDFASQFSQVIDLIVANNLVFVILGDPNDYSHLMVSYDGGSQWQLAENGITFQNSYGGVGHLIGVGGALVASTVNNLDGVFISLDSAQTWLPFNDGLSDFGVGKLVADGTYLYAATNGQGVWRRSLADLNLGSISGKIYRDDNNNGILDNGEAPLPGILVRLDDASSFAVSRSEGFYKIFSSFLQPDVLSVMPPNPYAISNPSQYAVSQSETGKDFGIYFPPGIEDLRVELTHYGVPRPGFDSHFGITYKNVGTTIMNGTVQLNIDAQMDFVSANPVPSQVNGNQLIWDFNDLQLLETRSITVNVHLSSSVPIGTELAAGTSILPITNDADPSNNQDYERLLVVGSFDPNDKRVEPGESLTLEDLAAGIPLTYTIRFQNTGTYQADRVRIADYLSQLLDVSTFQFLASSHPCTYDIRGNGLLEFDFDMINLPDSSSNEQASHGFVKFSIRPKSDLSVGSLIQNKASIYFDFNLPIITNQVSTQIVELTQIATQIQQPAGFHIFPNPSAGDFTVQFESVLDEALDVAVFDLQGRLVRQKNGVTNHPINLSMPEASSGIYILKGKSGGKILAGRVLIQR